MKPSKSLLIVALIIAAIWRIEVELRGWGGLIWIDLRDRYGITQLLLEEGRTDQSVIDTVRTLGREYVIQAKGKVVERL